jgi:hypothetical protein
VIAAKIIEKSNIIIDVYDNNKENITTKLTTRASTMISTNKMSIII